MPQKIVEQEAKVEPEPKLYFPPMPPLPAQPSFRCRCGASVLTERRLVEMRGGAAVQVGAEYQCIGCERVYRGDEVTR